MAMATRAQRLVEAEAAYHDLLLGKAVVEFRDQNGEMLRYGQANRTALRGYIAQLKLEIAAEANGTTVDEGPLRVVLI